ncbi:DUF4956 domain-containing protein [Draconibacterium sp. IB214405]|uniref:DUF4956 domain-containing protein n=1 Tax=Draconibacterium sp. IB214405 TaxID=3097352 RepID=UPI002A144998|nr:DUF4956 domain-containing protein [Draconibacterium sp. IB214405]MDX8337916.1 DUF4956 domain-containing protein [Draconibacterium sp. IB214405]
MIEQQLVNISGEPWSDFLIRLLVNVISIFILIRFIYYPRNSRVKYIFTFFLMGMMIFLIASILDKVSLDMGFALGLFAIFGIIRYRSPSIDLKEMTYLFLVIGVSIINALVEFSMQTLIGLIIANLIIIVSALIMEHYKPKGYVLKRAMVYTPSNYSVLNDNQTLLEEIRQNTGINVLRVEIDKINKAKNEITVWIYFRENNPGDVKEHHSTDLATEDSTRDWESTNSNSY